MKSKWTVHCSRGWFRGGRGSATKCEKEVKGVGGDIRPGSEKHIPGKLERKKRRQKMGTKKIQGPLQEFEKRC